MKKLTRDETEYANYYYEASAVDLVYTELEAQLADAKQVANDCRIVADNASAEASAVKKDAERWHKLILRGSVAEHFVQAIDATVATTHTSRGKA